MATSFTLKKNQQKKSSLPPLFLPPNTLPTAPEQGGPVYGLEIVESIEKALPGIEIECVQRCNGMWRIILWDRNQRTQLIQTGITIRGYAIGLYGENPLLVDGKESIKLTLRNVHYSIADEEVIKALKKIKLTLTSDVRMAQYRNKDGKLLETKNGERFIYVVPPDDPLPESVRIAGITNGYLIYKGMPSKKDRDTRDSQDNQEKSNENNAASGPENDSVPTWDTAFSWDPKQNPALEGKSDNSSSDTQQAAIKPPSSNAAQASQKAALEMVSTFFKNASMESSSGSTGSSSNQNNNMPTVPPASPCPMPQRQGAEESNNNGQSLSSSVLPKKDTPVSETPSTQPDKPASKGEDSNMNLKDAETNTAGTLFNYNFRGRTVDRGQGRKSRSISTRRTDRSRSESGSIKRRNTSSDSKKKTKRTKAISKVIAAEEEISTVVSHKCPASTLCLRCGNYDWFEEKFVNPSNSNSKDSPLG